MIVSTLRRTCVVTQPDEWEKRSGALLARMTPYLQQQQGFILHDLARDGEHGGMIETTQWRSAADCTAYLRNGAAAMTATWLDAFFPTAPFPNGNWLRESHEQP